MVKAEATLCLMSKEDVIASSTFHIYDLALCRDGIIYKKCLGDPIRLRKTPELISVSSNSCVWENTAASGISRIFVKRWIVRLRPSPFVSKKRQKNSTLQNPKTNIVFLQIILTVPSLYTCPICSFVKWDHPPVFTD